ncbi:MAG: hypothetical protein M3Y85_07820, partial [Bacteroidota bacterium]|nr:hypothetical protein [Bacteroidota bacterium]
MKVIEDLKKNHKNEYKKIKILISAYDGNLLICHSNCCIQKPVDDLFLKVAGGNIVAERVSKNKPVADLGAVPSLTGYSMLGINSSKGNLLTQNTNGGENDVSRHMTIDEEKIFIADDFFIIYQNQKEVNHLLQLFFKKNEEESIPNLVKRVHLIDPGVIQKEIQVQNNRPLVQKLLHFITGKQGVIQRYQNKL